MSSEEQWIFVKAAVVFFVVGVLIVILDRFT